MEEKQKVVRGKALIIGGEHQNTLGVIESLGQKGVSSLVVIIGPILNGYVLKSKYIECGKICKSDEDAVAAIKFFLSNEQKKIVAIACSDDAANILDKHYYELCQLLVIPTVKEAGSLIAWTDKDKMTETAKRLGITTPASWLISDAAIPEDIVYPCVIKPITSVKHGKAGFAKCANKDELQAYLDAKKDGEPVQVQQFVEKDFEFQFIGCSLNSGEEVIIPGRSHIERTTGFNNITFLRYGQNDSSFNDTVALSEIFVKETGYSGLFSIEYMRGKDGKDYFLEMNFRNDGNCIAVTSAGTNLPFIWYLYSSGGDYKGELAKSEVKTVYLMPEFSFLLSMLSGEVPLREWLADRKKTTCLLTKFEDDIEPYKEYCRIMKPKVFLGIIKFILLKLHIYSFVKRLTRN